MKNKIYLFILVIVIFITGLSHYEIHRIKQELQQVKRVSELRLRISRVHLCLRSIDFFISSLPQVTVDKRDEFVSRVSEYSTIYQSDIHFLKSYSMSPAPKSLEKEFYATVKKDEDINKKQVHAIMVSKDLDKFSEFSDDAIDINTDVDAISIRLSNYFENRIYTRVYEASKMANITLYSISSFFILFMLISIALGVATSFKIFKFTGTTKD